MLTEEQQAGASALRLMNNPVERGRGWQGMDTTRKLVIIVANPASGTQDRSAELQRLQAAIEASGLRVELFDALDLARQSIAQATNTGDLRAVVAAGGDGTICSVASMTPADIPLQIFPMGTENLLAKYLGVSRDIDAVCASLHRGRRVPMDAGRVDGKLFLVVATCGFDAEVVWQMERIRRGHISRWTYTAPILRSMWRYRFPRIAVRTTSTAGELEWTAAWVFVFNVPRYAAGLPICRQADPADGWLDVCTFDRGGVFWGFWYLIRLWMGNHHRSRGFRHVRARHLELFLPHGEGRGAVPPCFQIDGDIGGQLPVSIAVEPQRVCFQLPPHDYEKGE
ncbi:MAG: hypothetical protein D6753_00225 [Planctomycetota bacterium]|nr:MAG: hypothetical protein D6753_00225 [Planctomycetota bacterium]